MKHDLRWITQALNDYAAKADPSMREAFVERANRELVALNTALESPAPAAAPEPNHGAQDPATPPAAE